MQKICLIYRNPMWIIKAELKKTSPRKNEGPGYNIFSPKYWQDNLPHHGERENFSYLTAFILPAILLFTRATLFGWTIPFLAALSIAEARTLPAAFIDSASVAASSFLVKVLMRLVAARLRSVRVAVLRMSFFDD